MFATIKRILPYYTALIIGFGVLRNYIYYSYFNVHIRHIFATSEFFLLFMDEVFLYLIAVTIPVLLFHFFTSNTIARWNGEAFMEEARKTFLQRLRSSTYIIAIILIFVNVILVLTKSDYGSRFIATVSALTIALPILVDEVKFKYDLIYSTPFRFTHLYLIRLFIWTGTAIALFSYQDALKVDDGRYVGTVVHTKDAIYISTEDFFFIGKTDTYTLLHDKYSRRTTIIPNSEIIKLTLSKQ